MTTFFCRPGNSRGHGHERVGRGAVTPQATLSFAPGRPPTFDPSPVKASNCNRNSWPGQMWNHLTNMFTSPPPVQWVNPHVMRECPLPPLFQYDDFQQYTAMPCTIADPGEGLWHPAPPGNLQQQQMMDPLQMFQANSFFPMGKMDNVFPVNKMDTHNVFPVGNPDIPVCSSKTSTQRLNPNAQEWVPREYRTTLPPPVSTTSTGHVVMEEMLHQNHHLSPTPVIPYIPQDFCEITEEEVEEVRVSGCPLPPPSTVLPPPGTGSVGQCQNMVPQCSSASSSYLNETETASTSDISRLENEGMCESVTCLTSTHPEESTKVGSQVQSSTFVSPCHWESSASQVVMCKESERGSAGQSCVSCVCPGQSKVGSPMKCIEPQSPLPPRESNRARQEALCPSPKNSASPQAASPGTSERSASPDQLKHRSATPASLGCMKNEKQKEAPVIQNTTLKSASSVSLSPTQMANSAPESCRLSPEWLPSHPTCSRKSTSPGKDVVASLEVLPTQRVVVSATEDFACSNQKCPSPVEVTASILYPEYTQSVPDSTTLSYAGVVLRASPSPPPEQLKYKGVEQPLSKIFQRDSTPPREPVTSRAGTERRMPELFRRPTKTQRMRSRKFLDELKELGETGGGGGTVWCGSSTSSISSSPSSLSSSSDLSQSPDVSSMPSSPSHVISPISVSPSHYAPLMERSSSQAIPIPPCGASPRQVESPGSRTRSSSESSTASLDIEFVEQNEVDQAPSINPPCSPRRASASLGVRNGFLACILGSGDSDSEEEDDWDADWDEVCVADSDSTSGLDDSWETFGLGLVVMDCQMEPSEDQGIQCQAKEPETEEHGGSPHLTEINRRWEEAVGRDVKGKSGQQVKFGGEKVHPMVMWGYAYREARRGPWEQQARDRARFAQRIATLEPALSRVFEPSHRRTIYYRLHAPSTPARCFL